MLWNFPEVTGYVIKQETKWRNRRIQLSPIKPDKADLQKQINTISCYFFVLENIVIFAIYVRYNGFITISFQRVNFSVLISIIVNIKENPHRR